MYIDIAFDMSLFLWEAVRDSQAESGILWALIKLCSYLWCSTLGLIILPPLVFLYQTGPS